MARNIATGGVLVMLLLVGFAALMSPANPARPVLDSIQLESGNNSIGYIFYVDTIEELEQELKTLTPLLFNPNSDSIEIRVGENTISLFLGVEYYNDKCHYRGDFSVLGRKATYRNDTDERCAANQLWEVFQKLIDEIDKKLTNHERGILKEFLDLTVGYVRTWLLP